MLDLLRGSVSAPEFRRKWQKGSNASCSTQRFRKFLSFEMAIALWIPRILMSLLTSIRKQTFFFSAIVFIAPSSIA